MLRPEDLAIMDLNGHLLHGDDSTCWCHPRVIHISQDGSTVRVHGVAQDGEPPQEILFTAIIGSEYGIEVIPPKELN